MPSMKIRFTTIPAQYPIESTPAEITKHSMDSTYQLDQYLNIFKRYRRLGLAKSLIKLNGGGGVYASAEWPNFSTDVQRSNLFYRLHGDVVSNSMSDRSQ